MYIILSPTLFLSFSILYERLAAVPPSPEPDRQPLPPLNSVSQPYHHQPSMDADPGFVDYMRSHPSSRGGPSAKDVSNEPYAPPRSSRRDSGSSMLHDTRLGPSILAMQPPMDPSRSSHSRSHMHTSPTTQHSQPAQPKYVSSRPPPALYDRYTDLPPVQRVMHSPDRDRRRQDLHELNIPNHPLAPLSPPSDSRSSSSRTHNHQRLGPGTYINRDDVRERPRDADFDREWDARDRDRRDHSRSRDLGPSGHMRSPPNPHRASRHDIDYSEHRLRDDYYHEVGGGRAPAPGFAMHSRSETPGSGSGGSGSGGGANAGPDASSRPDSREQYYDHDRPRSFRLRPVGQQQQEDLGFVHEDGRSHSHDRGGSGGGGVYTSSSEQGRSLSRIDARKRRDIDVMDIDDGPPAASSVYAGHDRSSKRFQRDRPRGADDPDDDRMAA